MKEKEQIVPPPQAKDSGVVLTPPDGCEIEKVEIVDGKAGVDKTQNVQSKRLRYFIKKSTPTTSLVIDYSH